MKEAIYSWIKCLAIFYILLTMLIHLVPTGKYQRYVRFFMGLLLMVMLITPMLSILEKAKTLPESFSSLYQQEEKKRLTLDLENLQKSLLEKGVEEQLEKNTDAERTVLEKKLEDLLSQTEGVGKVQVLLMTGEEKDSSSFYDSGNQAVTGVLIAAEGADNSVVSRNIVEGVMALFQLDAHKIKVMKMK